MPRKILIIALTLLIFMTVFYFSRSDHDFFSFNRTTVADLVQMSDQDQVFLSGKIEKIGDTLALTDFSGSVAINFNALAPQSVPLEEPVDIWGRYHGASGEVEVSNLSLRAFDLMPLGDEQ